ncbi:uncharacterized protein BXZ73DRAFT_89228 [Epithele typhae]|uniref:uncharacterized protein n=1 Tax=Epithele typhae TaxID=378194 RepID=UPI0020074DA5|nr:uncharacterized protein BXZ73DRAFT_89228 [Epithele typhae]KAH9937793.1 hypothetical protein BXZ73DRAFT_89228 [Epithele typhae]
MTKSTVLGIHLDSGVPTGSSTYTTVVVFHGYACHGGIFAKLIPLAPSHNARIVVVNRRDYPGSQPYSDIDLKGLRNGNAALKDGDQEKARALIAAFMRARAREVYDFLADLIEGGDVREAQPKKNAGGLVVVGWSFATVWMTALLAHVAEFETVAAPLSKYMRRVVILDGPYHVLGYQPPGTNIYNPLWDPDATVEDFAFWVSGYYRHGDTEGTLEGRTPLKSPAPTLMTLTDEERASTLFPSPSDPDGSDQMLLVGGRASGVFSDLRKAAFALPPTGKNGAVRKDVEIRCVWCDASIWEMVWARWKMEEELQAAKETRISMREVESVRLAGCNHFVGGIAVARCMVC